MNESGNSEKRHWVVGVLCAKLKLHKITPNTQGIRSYDVMISGEVQSFALPLILNEIRPVNMVAVEAVMLHLDVRNADWTGW